MLTLWPPGPLEQKVSIRRSFASIWMSTSSASGRTATVAVEVWMRPLASVAGTRCTRWTPLSYLSLLYAPRPSISGDDFLEAAASRLARRHQLDPPALTLGVARVHPEELSRKQGSFVAACARANLEHDVLLVVGVLGHEEHLEVGDERVAPDGQRLELLLGEVAHVGVGAGDEFLGLRDVPRHGLILAERGDDRFDL